MKKNIPSEKKISHQSTETKLKINQLSELVDKIPGSIYWKDKNGYYLGRNEFSFIKTLKQGYITGNSTKDAIIGKTDYELLSTDQADLFRTNDLFVIESGREIIIEEPLFLPNGKKIVQLSNKKPLYDKSNCIIGVIGNTIDTTKLWSFDSSNPPENVPLFTDRQLECILGIVKGLTMKQIGRALDISYRTVECHIDAIKTKLKCRSRSELISKSLALDIVKKQL